MHRFVVAVVVAVVVVAAAVDSHGAMASCGTDHCTIVGAPR